MLRRRLLVFSALGLVGLIGLTIWYDSTHPSRVERMVACFEKLGYSTSAFHDDGIEALTGQDPDIMVLFGGSMQVRPPSTQVSASLPGGGLVTVTVPDGGGTSRTAFSHGVPPRSAGQRAAVANCANS